MRRTLLTMIATALAAGLSIQAEARRPTPVPSFILEDGRSGAVAMLANQNAFPEAQGEDLLELMGRSLYVSADAETAQGGITLYFLRIEDNGVRAVQTTRIYEDDLAEMRARFPEDADLPGESFLFGSAMVPVDIYLGAERDTELLGDIAPQGKREELLFASALRVAQGGSGFAVAAFPMADGDSLAGGGFFLPQ